ncbi:hypothetical protein NPIL_103981 [Nephila pilipes]|uniref:Secreted protein n=1 Tax=Nephila pilipes TaxID=299642 RepID=A0A8X6PF53_NEPPI|nr:hypothetical protein NPIL_103981 [Nephila pilipes]
MCLTLLFLVLDSADGLSRNRLGASPLEPSEKRSSCLPCGLLSGRSFWSSFFSWFVLLEAQLDVRFLAPSACLRRSDL